MDLEAINRSYRRWAPIYDSSFGLITRAGRRRAVDYINTRDGAVLEVGVGTGLSLDDYAAHLEVTGIDVSAEMLDKARRKVAERGLSHVRDLQVMDARTLEFPDAAFDTVVGMYLVSVVPEPERVMAEMARVCKPGGEVLVVNHFARDRGVLSWLERGFAPLANLLGWHSDFDQARIMGVPELELRESARFPPFGMFSFLRFAKAG
jgi:phosphatidylethanolamine/phosphatidyl-N-methylethanolamine N-methyltransferase